MKGKLGYLGLVVFCVLFAGCSTISGWFTSASTLPSAQTLLADCAAGKAATPPVRDNACDVYNVLQNICLGQAELPINFVQACTVAGYQVTGTFTPQLKQ